MLLHTIQILPRLSYVPVHPWQLNTLGRPQFDPTKRPVIPTQPYLQCSDVFLLINTVTSFGVWLRFTRVPLLRKAEYPQYSFVFTRIRLNQPAFHIFNIVFYVLFLVSCLVALLMQVLSWP